MSLVNWDSELKSEMEVNIIKSFNIIAQRFEQRLLLDENSLHMGDRVSSAQVIIY